MKYTVIWTEEARDQLAEVWLAASDRDDVTSATYTIDQLLSHNPESRGESREIDERRILFVSPLVVIYRINDGDRQVVVSNVRHF